MRRLALAALLTVPASLVLASLGVALPWDREPAHLAVDVLRGFASPAPSPAPAGRVDVLLDARASMQDETSAGPPRWDAARVGAQRFLAALPEGTAVALHALGGGAATCAPARELAHAAAGTPRDALDDALEALSPRGGGSLAEALAALAAAGGASHVVVFTDLAADCGGDLCAAARWLAESGAQLDLVVLGGAEPPECVREASAGFANVADEPTVLVPPRYQVYREGEGEDEGPLAEGWIGDEPISLDAQRVEVVVALDPPARVGPVALVPGGSTRLSLVEFPGLAPRVREWSWQTEAPPAAPASPDVSADVSAEASEGPASPNAPAAPEPAAGETPEAP